MQPLNWSCVVCGAATACVVAACVVTIGYLIAVCVGAWFS